jgi:hypothetical protein
MDIHIPMEDIMGNLEENLTPMEDIILTPMEDTIVRPISGDGTNAIVGTRQAQK